MGKRHFTRIVRLPVGVTLREAANTQMTRRQAKQARPYIAIVKAIRRLGTQAR